MLSKLHSACREEYFAKNKFLENYWFFFENSAENCHVLSKKIIQNTVKVAFYMSKRTFKENNCDIFGLWAGKCRTLGKNFWQCCQNCILRFQRNLLEKFWTFKLFRTVSIFFALEANFFGEVVKTALRNRWEQIRVLKKTRTCSLRISNFWEKMNLLKELYSSRIITYKGKKRSDHTAMPNFRSKYCTLHCFKSYDANDEAVLVYLRSNGL